MITCRFSDRNHIRNEEIIESKSSPKFDKVEKGEITMLIIRKGGY